MPIYNYVIGIGGVGARNVEAVVRMCENGYISCDELTCFVIDSDKDNGNVDRTIKLINSYNDTRKELNPNGSEMDFFKTKLVGISGSENEYFTPPFDKNTAVSQGRTVSIENIVGRGNPTAINSMKFHYTKEEYEENLEKGFYGRPAVGAFVFALNSVPGGRGSSRGIQALFNQIVRQASDPNTTKIRIALEGSNFGGTGNAGMPYIAKTIHALVSAIPNTVRANAIECLEIFGCFMMPYFKYEEDNANKKINHDRFEGSAYEAMTFLKDVPGNPNDLYKKFKKIYIIGDPGKPSRGKYHEEGSNQKNMPHIAELFAAAQAGAFFNGYFDNNNALFANKKDYADPCVLQDAARGIDQIEFETCEVGNENGLKNKIEDFIIFNYCYSKYIIPLMFDYAQTGYFTSWSSKNAAGDKEINKERAKKLTKINILKDFWTQKGLMGKFSNWNNTKVNTKGSKNYIDETKFAGLYKYLTGSALWYYEIVHEYNKDAKRCSECKTCTLNKTDGFYNFESKCAKTGVLLPDLFGAAGAEMLRNRSFLPEWIAKHPESKKELWNCNRNPLGKIEKDAVRTHRRIIKKFKNATLDTDGETLTSEVLFKKLILKIYSVITAVE